MTIQKVTDEIIATVSQRQQYDYEIICINDFSPDNVYEKLRKLAAKNIRIKVINFAKNMGKHSAVMAGYSVARGDYIVNLDDDYQSPTYELWRLLEPVEKDKCDYATAKYHDKKQSAFKNFGSNLNLLMSRIVLEKPKDLRFENFSVMKGFVKDEMIKYRNPYPYLDGLILRVTCRVIHIEMEQRSRADDNITGFTFIKSLSLWMNGLTAFSVKPLRISSFFGAMFAAFGFASGIFIIIRRIINPDMPAGYASLLATLLFCSGVIMLLLGLIGEYIGRIYICLNASPQYVIKNTLNIESEENKQKDVLN